MTSTKIQKNIFLASSSIVLLFLVSKVLFLIILVALVNIVIKHFMDDFAIFDIEFSTFSTVLLTVSFGIYYGLIAAIVTCVPGYIFNSDVDEKLIFSVIGYVLAAFVSLFLIPGYIVTGGIIISVFVSAFITSGIILSGDASSVELLGFSVTSIVFNIYLFINFANPALKLLLAI